jgi:hypothetical protein
MMGYAAKMRPATLDGNLQGLAVSAVADGRLSWKAIVSFLAGQLAILWANRSAAGAKSP